MWDSLRKNLGTKTTKNLRENNLKMDKFEARSKLQNIGSNKHKNYKSSQEERVLGILGVGSHAPCVHECHMPPC